MLFLETYRKHTSLLYKTICYIFIFCLFPFSLLVLLQMGLLVGLPVHGYRQSVFLKRLPIQQYICQPQAGSTPLRDASLVYPCNGRCGMCFDFQFLFYFWVHFNLTAKGLNIPRQLPPGISSLRGLIIIAIIVIVIIINTTL